MAKKFHLRGRSRILFLVVVHPPSGVVGLIPIMHIRFLFAYVNLVVLLLVIQWDWACAPLFLVGFLGGIIPGFWALIVAAITWAAGNVVLLGTVVMPLFTLAVFGTIGIGTILLTAYEGQLLRGVTQLEGNLTRQLQFDLYYEDRVAQEAKELAEKQAATIRVHAFFDRPMEQEETGVDEDVNDAQAYMGKQMGKIRALDSLNPGR